MQFVYTACDTATCSTIFQNSCTMIPHISSEISQ